MHMNSETGMDVQSYRLAPQRTHMLNDLQCLCAGNPSAGAINDQLSDSMQPGIMCLPDFPPFTYINLSVSSLTLHLSPPRTTSSY